MKGPRSKKIQYDKNWPKWKASIFPISCFDQWMIWKNDWEYITISDIEYQKRYKERNKEEE